MAPPPLPNLLAGILTSQRLVYNSQPFHTRLPAEGLQAASSRTLPQSAASVAASEAWQGAHLVGLSGVVQDAFCASGLASINVGTDTDVSIPLQRHNARACVTDLC